jgi:hypothetical protein
MLMHGTASALLIMAGALCALSGYVIGTWRQRSLLRVELEAEDMESHQRVMEMIESLADGPGTSKDNRPN